MSIKLEMICERDLNLNTTVEAESLHPLVLLEIRPSYQGGVAKGLNSQVLHSPCDGGEKPLNMLLALSVSF